MKKYFTLLSLLLAINFLLKAQDQADKAQDQVDKVKPITLIQFSSGYNSPLGIENCGDSRLFIVTRVGQIFACDSLGNKQTTPFLDLKNRVTAGGEKGLLCLAFDPDYLNNGYFYVDYVNKTGNVQISRFTVSSDSSLADTTTEKLILTTTESQTSHYGGCIRFGPDGYLYISMGDGGGVGDPLNNAQNPMSLLGKILRIDVHTGDPYAIPADNPFADSANARPEIWALGLRNPWRLSFDAVSGDLFIGDVGAATWEEVDQQLAGQGGLNYGWRCFEGKHKFNKHECMTKLDYARPVFEYMHSDTGCAVIGGFVYRGSKYPSIYGQYFFSDYCSGIIRTFYPDGTWRKAKDVYNGDDYSYTSFGEGYDHELYVTDFSTQSIYRITDGTSLPQKNYAAFNSSGVSLLTVSPNPSNGNFTITYKSEKSQVINIHIQNIMGQQFYYGAKNLNAGMNTWKMNLHLSMGDYYISITDASGKIVNQQLRIQ